MNRQSGDDKLNHVGLLKFYILVAAYISRNIEHAQWRFSIVSMRTWSFGQNISETDSDRYTDTDTEFYYTLAAISRIAE